MLNAVRPNRVFLSTFAVPAVILPLAGYFWMRRNDSFIEMSIGSNPRRFSEIGAWISVAVAASALYAVPASLVLLLSRRRQPKFRNSAVLLTLFIYLAALGVWLAARRG